MKNSKLFQRYKISQVAMQIQSLVRSSKQTLNHMDPTQFRTKNEPLPIKRLIKRDVEPLVISESSSNNSSEDEGSTDEELSDVPVYNTRRIAASVGKGVRKSSNQDSNDNASTSSAKVVGKDKQVNNPKKQPNVHAQAKKFFCGMCDTNFTQKEALVHHMKHAH